MMLFCLLAGILLGIILLYMLPSHLISTFRVLSLSLTGLIFILVFILCLYFDGSGEPYQFLTILPGLHMCLGLDVMGISLLLLTSMLFPVCVLLMRTREGILCFLLLELFIMGSLMVLDLLGFYILFEASLILLFLLISRPPYGSIEASYLIFLYTLGGSLIFLPVILLMYCDYGTTNLLCQVQGTYIINDVGSIRSYVYGWGMLMVFGVKIPLVPLHLWLPEAHVAAPTAGSVLLAGVLLKLGCLGFIRFMIPIVPAFSIWIYPLVCIMCLSGFVYSTLSTIRQLDLKKIVAYSSIAHMSLVTLTIFSTSEHSVMSSTYMMIAHGLVSPLLFLLVGILYERCHTKYLMYYGGLGSIMPLYSVVYLLCTLANLSFPLFPNFIAEVLCLVSIFSSHPIYAYVYCISQVLGAVYGFWAFNRVVYGQSLQFTKTSVVDLSRYELMLLLPLILGVMLLGLGSLPF